MVDDLEKLVEVAGPALGGQISYTDCFEQINAWALLGQELSELLAAKNGFYAYGSALLVRPLRSQGAVRGLGEWNRQALWKHEYDVDLRAALFFAEDLFGHQYGVVDDRVCYFETETGTCEPMAVSLRDWCRLVMTNPERRTSYPLGRHWQETNGPIPPGKRLSPRCPFVCGGEYAASNLYLGDEVEVMRFRGHLATQIRHLPDGAPIQFEIVE